MHVQSASVEHRGRLKRPIVSAFATALFALLLYLYLPIPAPNVPPASAGDCVELHLFSNGYHSDIGAPADLFPADHPLRRLYPQARQFLIGWGDEKFYYSDGANLLLGLDAIIPPSPSVMHVAYNAPGAAAYLSPSDDTGIAVSREGAARFVAYIDRALVLDPHGDVIVTHPGKVIGHSSFVRTRGSFHLFNVCNQWMARALRAAGIDVNARAAWLAGGLIHQVREVARTSCRFAAPRR
jgi:uncharacterized protein (TIGR02117 family)